MCLIQIMYKNKNISFSFSVCIAFAYSIYKIKNTQWYDKIIKWKNKRLKNVHEKKPSKNVIEEPSSSDSDCIANGRCQ